MREVAVQSGTIQTFETLGIHASSYPLKHIQLRRIGHGRPGVGLYLLSSPISGFKVETKTFGWPCAVTVRRFFIFILPTMAPSSQLV